MHTAKTTKDAVNLLDLEVLPQPAYSPDFLYLVSSVLFSPIQNVKKKS